MTLADGTYWVYYRAGSDVIYDRNCATRAAAEQRVAELVARGKNAWHQPFAHPRAFV